MDGYFFVDFMWYLLLGNDEIGIMFFNMNVLCIVNVKSINVLDNFNFCKEYVNMEIYVFVVVVVFIYFGMKLLEICVKEVIFFNMMR